jgi:hypothetical protein
MHTDTAGERDAVDVVGWRCEQLVASGFPAQLAADLADDPRYDLHALSELVERGCDVGLAVRILAPLGEESAA